MSAALDTIIEVLAPVLGEHMARAVVTGSAEKMNIRPDSPADLGRLLHQLGLGLNVFVGRVKSKALVQELERKLSLAASG